MDWLQLTQLYGEVGLVTNFGKNKDLNKIKEAFTNSYKVITAWNDKNLINFN